MKARSSDHPPWFLLWIGGLFCLGLALPVVHSARQDAASTQLADSPYLRIDPEKIVLSEKDARVPCGECHQLEYDVWKETPHATGFDELHRSAQAQGILDRMGFKLSKRESLCLRCHYTAIIKNDQARAIAGVSCESCHGAARDWLNVHNDYGGADRDTETDEHRQQRIAQSVSGGMLRPSMNLYAVAANCFECHTVPNEKLINVGGHPSGSNFDLNGWSERIRHNFLQAQWSADESNRAPTPARKRVMYVIGAALDYEYSIRAAAAAEEEGIYAKAMERRVKQARRGLDKVYREATIPQVQAILNRGSNLNIVPNNRANLIAAADAISRLTQQFAQENDGSQLDGIDRLLEGGAVAAAPPAVDEGGEGTEGAGTEGTGTEGAGTEGAAPTTPAAGAVAVAGTQRPRPAWFDAPKHATLGPGGCSCHIDQQRWWNDDQHSKAAQPLLDEAPRAVQIATTYGLTAAQMKRGNQICMNCHGTIITGDEAEEVFDGVSCENCHGPGADFQLKHQPPNNYASAASLGMVNLEQLDARTGNCARCHHITDERLISAGHPTGAGFDPGEREQKIKHWKAPTPSAADLNAAFARVLERRPLPENVPVATPAVTTPPVATPPVAAQQDSATTDPTSTDPAPTDPAPTDPAPTDPATPATATPATPVVAVAGIQRPRPAWFAREQHATLGPSGCGCHIDQQRWWNNDKHSNSARPLLNGSAKALQIASTYGLTAAQMKRGNQICMNCHGTIITGDEAEEVFDGVSCENCHGPGADYINTHQPPPKGYATAAATGLINLEQLDARANNCARCHHITDERLISAGHPTGAGFDLGQRDRVIKHWKAPTPPAGGLNAAFSRVKAQRPLPQNVTVATPVAVTPTPAGGNPVGARPRPPRPRPVDRSAPPPLSTGSLGDLPALPAVSDSTSTEDILLIVKQRLELLYKALGRDQ